MRPIKFRAWDKVGKQMFYRYPRRWEEMTSKETSLMTMDLEALAISLDGDLYMLDECGRYDYPKRDEFELMQFTGLLDKNGKEIYEGDIVQDKEASMKGVDEFGEIVFIDGKFQLKSPCFPASLGFNYFDLVNCIDHFEVIGNIYESPELIEKDGH